MFGGRRGVAAVFRGVGAGFVGGVAAGYQGCANSTFAAASQSNPQPFTGYWKLPGGEVVSLKQWGDRVTGDLSGSAVRGALTLKTEKGELTLDKSLETATLNGKSVTRTAPELVVVCGPSGVGKGTLVNMLLKEYPDMFGFSVSHTTRKPRPGEVDGVDYNFTDVEKMKAMIDQDMFIEYAHVHSNYYGTSKQAIKDVQNKGKICILDIDVQGAQKVAAAKIPFVGVFVKPPSVEELEGRLRGRGTETPEKITLRIENSKKEVAFCDSHTFFWYELVNDNLEACYRELKQSIAQATGARDLPKVSYGVNPAPACGVEC